MHIIDHIESMLMTHTLKDVKSYFFYVPDCVVESIFQELDLKLYARMLRDEWTQYPDDDDECGNLDHSVRI